MVGGDARGAGAAGAPGTLPGGSSRRCRARALLSRVRCRSVILLVPRRHTGNHAGRIDGPHQMLAAVLPGWFPFDLIDFLRGHLSVLPGLAGVHQLVRRARRDESPRVGNRVITDHDHRLRDLVLPQGLHLLERLERVDGAVLVLEECGNLGTDAIEKVPFGADGRDIDVQRLRDPLLGNAALDDLQNHLVLLERREAVDLAIESDSLVVERDQTGDFVDTEVFQNFDSEMAVEKQILVLSVGPACHDGRLHDADFTNGRGDLTKFVALAGGIVDQPQRQNVGYGESSRSPARTRWSPCRPCHVSSRASTRRARGAGIVCICSARRRVRK